MKNDDLPIEFKNLLESIKSKRPRTVIEHILKHGYVTTEELKDIYGYNHPPRAIRDVREQGIPIETYRVTGSDGRQIAAYKFGDPDNVRNAKLSGRTAFSNKLKTQLIEKSGTKCNIYLEEFPERELQIDHRIPFEINGDELDLSENPDDYMLLSASANRAKSWSCEHCPNWSNRIIDICKTCYWAFPEKYSHIATRDIRRVDILWSGDEISEYTTLKSRADQVKEPVPEYIKNIIRNHLEKN